MKHHMTRRDILKFGAGVALGPVDPESFAWANPVPSSAAGLLQRNSEVVPWYRSLSVGIEWGPTGANDLDSIYCSKALGKEIIRFLAKARAEYAVIFMRDQTYTYYNSTVARKCPNLGESDLLSECLDEAKKLKMAVIAYCQIQYATSSWEAHPEWRMKDYAGKDIPGRLCYRSGYLNFIKKLAAELMEYEISGFHFDMLDMGFGAPYGCWCPDCQITFEKEYGTSMPEGVTWNEKWDMMLEFRSSSITDFCKQLYSFVKSKRPDLAVDFNYHGYPPFSWEVGQKPVQNAMNGDFVTAEGLPWIFGHNNPSLLSLFLQGARLGGPAQIATSRSVYNYHDFTVRPVADMKWEVLTYLAHGAQCTMVDKANYDGSSDPLVYERLAEIFEEARGKQEFFRHKPLQEVGIYYSRRSRDWYGREDGPKFMAAFWGAHKALLQSQISMGIVIDENVSLERLQQFPVIYLPGVAILSEREVGFLDEYVSGGGNLLVTGMTGLYDRFGRQLDQSVIAKIVGASLLRIQEDHPDNYLRLPRELSKSPAEFLLQNVPVDWPILTWGPLAVYEPTEAQAYGELLVAHRSRENQWSNLMSADRVVGPAVLVHRRGKGQVICVPCSLDAAYAGNYRVPEHRLLLRNLIRKLNPNPPVLVAAPLNVEAILLRDEGQNRLLLHLLAFWGPPTSTAEPFGKGRKVLPPLMEEAMLYEAHVQIQQSFLTARTLSSQASLTRDHSQIRLRTSAVHEVLIIQQ